NEYIYPNTREFDELLPFMELTELNFLLLGHTHSPFIFYREEDKRMILNPGSVGQPRDGDPRASYAVIDIDSMKARIERVEYDIDQVISDMDNLGFPQNLKKRLKLGK
ncbi:MAG: metallophosphoesterase family protein, partial [Candidatus Hodarchaeales archaeon]